jgi:hypothetical protein
MMEEARQMCSNDFFMEIFILGAWQIWKERNDLSLTEATPPFTLGNLVSWMKLSFRLIECGRTRKYGFLVL